MKYKGHIQDIEGGEAYCILGKYDESDLTEFELRISVEAFKHEVKIGMFVVCEELDDGNIEVRIVELPKWTKEDTERAKKRAEEISKHLKWE